MPRKNQKTAGLAGPGGSRGRIAALSAAAAGLPLLATALPAFGQISIQFTSSNLDDTINTPQTGSYTFEVYGGEGGSDFGGGSAGGYGAEVVGTYNFGTRNLLQIDVGAEGSTAVAAGFGGGGGGATYIYDEQASFLMAVAGGGGGAGVGGQGGAGQAGTAGSAGGGSGAGAGGTGGNGGQAAAAADNAAGGAGGGGYLSAGASATYFSTSTNGGGSYSGGLAGGTTTYGTQTYPSGGFGGGGGGLAGGGGGGGYSGGGGGTAENIGGGGGSYLDSGFTATTITSGYNSLFGYVEITPSTPNLTIQYTGSGHIGGDIYGAGSVTMSGTGVCYLTGNNSYSGGTTISAGTLVVGDGNAYGTLPGNVSLSGGTGTLAFDRSDTYTYSGNISGSGIVAQTGTGTTILAGTNSYTGQTTISAGTLQLGNGAAPGLITGNISDNASLVTALSGQQTYGGVISGSGSYTAAGPGVIDFSKPQTYAGATTIENTAIVEFVANALPSTTSLYLTSDFVGDGGGLSLNGPAVANPAQTVAALSGDGGGIALGTNGILTVNQSTNTVFAGQIYDSSAVGSTGTTGQLVKQGTGTLALTGANIYAGGTTISGGSLQIGNGAAAGSVAGNFTDNANLTFNRSDSFTFAGTISGTGSLTQAGSGTLVLTGTNTYSGGTTISAGSLQLGNGGSTGAINGNILDDANLTFDSTAGADPGLISGTGGITVDAGPVFLDHANTYAGNTVLNSADLFVDVTNALPVTTTLTVSSGTLLYGAASLTQTIAALSGNPAGGIQLSDLETNSNDTLVVNQSANTVFAGQIYDNTYFGGSDNGKVVKEGSGTLTLTAQNIYGGGTTINGGALQFGNGGSVTGTITDNTSLIFNRSDTVTVGNLIQGEGSITQAGSGTVTVTAANTYGGATNVSAGELIIDADALPFATPVAITGGVLQLAHNSGSEEVSSVNVSGGGQLDITNNQLFIAYYFGGGDPIANIVDYLRSGYNGGSWNGPGIISSTAQTLTNGLKYGVGFADAEDGTHVVSGLASGEIELKYTLLGDANLDGTVNGSDFSILAANFGLGVTNWDQGNFLYGSSVNGSDFSALAANFGQGDSGADVAVSQTDIAALDSFAIANGLPLPAIGAVPEPAGAGVILCGGAVVLVRRHRKQRLNREPSGARSPGIRLGGARQSPGEGEKTQKRLA